MKPDNSYFTDTDNESDSNADVDMLIEQIEIYDQIWYIRTMEKSDKFSTKQHSAKDI